MERNQNEWHHKSIDKNMLIKLKTELSR